MQRIELHFGSGQCPELQKTVLFGPRFLNPVVAVRGKGAGAYGRGGTFQWTRAVQAFAILLLRTRAFGDASSARIEGGTGTPAASLDYAISKRTQWLVDIFGGAGGSHYRRAFRRTNPERKQPGPVAISVNESFLSAENIVIFQSGQQLVDRLEIEQLTERVASQWAASQKIRVLATADVEQGSKEQGDRLASNDEQRTAHMLFRKLLSQEMRHVVNCTDIFSQGRLRASIDALRSNPSVSRLSGAKDFLSPMDCALPVSQRLGLADESYLRRHLTRTQPLRVALPAPGAGAAAIMLYLRDIKCYSFELDFSYPHAIEIGQRIRQRNFEREPDLAMLGIAPAAQILGQPEGLPFLPLMMMPKTTQRIIASRGAALRAGLSRCDYYLLQEDPSNPEFYLEELVRGGSMRERDIARHHLEPHEVFSQFENADAASRSILFFPHYNINKIFNDAVYVDDPQDERRYKEIFLFAHEHVMRDEHLARCIDIAVRDAWLALRAQPELIDRLVETLVADDSYITFTRRACGLNDWGKLSTKLDRVGLSWEAALAA